jgi:two-component system nitrate/nitrite sensor histidine kinase NarX
MMTRRAVIAPIEELRESAERIGAGNLETPVNVQGAMEIQSLSQSFEDMRAQLLASHREISSWADTLEDRVNQRTLELEALQEVSREISSHLDIQRVLSSVTEKSRQLLGGEAAFLCLLDDHRQMLNLQATSGPDDAVTHLSTSAQASLPDQILSADHALLCGIRDCRGSCEMMRTAYRTSHVAAPLRAGNRLIGALCVGNSIAGYFTEEDRTMLTRLADAAAIALENARLYERAERTAILEERQILAAEMHDGLAQTIDFIHLIIDYALEQARVNDSRAACETLERGRIALEQASTQTRDIITNLGQALPQRSSLQDQLASVIRECDRNGMDIQIDWSTDLKSPIMMSSQDSEQVVRVVREAILNAKKHSGATRITVCLKQEDSSRSVTIEDNGKGFDLVKPLDEDGLKHFGVSIMHARATRIGGTVDIRSMPGNGTTVTMRWPCGESVTGLVD